MLTICYALEPCEVFPTKSGVDERLSLCLRDDANRYNRWHTLIALAAPCVRSTSPPVRVCSAGSSASYFWRISCALLWVHELNANAKGGITFSRRPSWGASTVINNALIPRFSACCTTRRVAFLSVFTYLGGSEYLSISYAKHWISLRRRTVASIVVALVELRQRSRRMRRMPEWESAIYALIKWPWRGGGELRQTIWTTSCLAAALVRLSSPSGWPNFPRAVAVWNRC